MAVLVNAATRAVVQGATGSQGSFHTSLMLQYGTKIVAGVTPGKGGSSVHGIPIYDTVEESVKANKPNASIIFVPPFAAKDAVMEAIAQNLNLVVVITEGIPVKDSMEMLARARLAKARIVGPNTPGVITPGECKLGIMPGHIFKRGKIGLVSRSGTLTYEVAAELTKAGLGQSTCFGIGGDPLVGMSFIDALELFRNDDETTATVLIGEIGGDAEEQAAAHIEQHGYPKPVVAYVVGRAAPAGKRMGHAGAIVSSGMGTAQGKRQALEKAGVAIADRPAEVATKVSRALS